jgi:Flp pilus assembly protein TadD
VDITKLPLGAQEGFILSRVEGRTQVKDIVASTGMNQETVIDSIQNLMNLGVLSMDVVNPTDEPDEGMPTELPPELRVEKGDLPTEQRLRILQMEYICVRRTHYDVLGLKRTVPSGDIKRAFHETSREFHPDAFFRKEMGSFKPRLERIFKAVKKAYDVLSDEAQRRAYDKVIPPEEVFKPKPKAPEPTPAWKLDPRRQAEAEERRLKRNPMVQRVERAKRHLTRARELLASKQLSQAANEASLAAAQDPWDQEVKAFNDKLQGELKEERFLKLVAKVELLCAGTPSMDTEEDDKLLATVVKDALDIQSSNGPMHVRMGKALFKGKKGKLAKGPADRALKLLPDDEKALMLMVELLEDAALFQTAVRTLERAQQLFPAPEKEERLKRLRKAVDK